MEASERKRKRKSHNGQLCHSNWTTDHQQETLTQIGDNANAGCLICDVHEQAILKCFPEAAADTDGTVVERRHLLSSTLQPLRCPVKRLSTWFIELFHDSAEYQKGNADAVAMQRPIPPGDTASEISLRWAEDQIQQCAREHLECGPGHETLLPKRILDVGTQQRPCLKIEESTKFGRYACLSHCWGSKQDASSMACTTTENLSTFKAEIPWLTLPKTFQETISVVRRFGLRWLWIDMFCIIQDDFADWAAEASKMASIYQNAYITIAATSSSTSSSGLFTRAENSRWQPHRLTLPYPMSKLSLYARVELNHVFDPDEIEEFPLLQRAWVYQERLLSPRILHFAGYELNFECRQRSSCQCTGITTLTSHPKIAFASHFNQSLQWDTSGDIPSQPRRLAPASSGLLDEHHPTTWAEVVRAYMRLRLTYPADVLPALSGMAKQWNEGSDQYLAGLWQKSLTQDLLWSNVRVRTRPNIWTAPSWSWASTGLESSIYNKEMAIQKTWVVIEEAMCTPSSTDATGAVASGHLLISTRTLRGAVYYWDPVIIQPEVHLTPICRLSVENAWYHINFDYPIWEEGPGHLASGATVQIAAIATVEASQSSSEILKCLVLRPSTSGENTWERCGLATLWERTVLSVATDSCLDPAGRNYNVHPESWKVEPETPPDGGRKERFQETLALLEQAHDQVLKVV